MRTKKIFIIFVYGLIISSCSDNAKPARRVQVYNIESDTNTVSEVSNENDITLSPPDIIDNSIHIEDSSESKKQIVEEPPKTVRTKKFYSCLLDEFCKKFFDRKFAGMHYVPGSIKVDNMSEFDTNTIVVRGTHSFKSPIILRNNKEFKAIIRDDGYNKFHIDFQRYGVRLGGLKSTGILPFYYNPEE